MFWYLNKELKTFNTKGPRIKHVCRTAESVLGQTLATFENVDKSEDVDNDQGKLIIILFIHIIGKPK